MKYRNSEDVRGSWSSYCASYRRYSISYFDIIVTTNMKHIVQRENCSTKSKW